MTTIDADKFLAYLIYSKHIDGLTCGEVKEAVEMCKVDVLGKIRAEIMQLDYDIEDVDYDYNNMTLTEVVHTICREEVLQVIDKYKAESDHKCHNCKHYTSGERDGSCGSYICKNYSGWESEDEE